MNRILPHEIASKLLRSIGEQHLNYSYDPEKHRLALLDENHDAWLYFRLPITVTQAQEQFHDHLPVNYVLLLIQSGNCALGYFENGQNRDHKVFRSYMVRKKQGKSQIKYLKTKGKSRAGSRVRLAETLEFFENINGRLQEYFEDHSIDRIAISCSKTLLPYLYGSKTETPFTKDDARLLKIPRHIHTPIYEVLLDTNRYLLRGELIYDEARQEQVAQLLAEAGITDETYIPGDEDEWGDEAQEYDADDDAFEDEDDEMEW